MGQINRETELDKTERCDILKLQLNSSPELEGVNPGR